jgi:DNA-directed RNA polymerase sigma subunit (sigma70/sigma32)
MNKILKDTTCFKEHKKANKNCEKRTCRQWLECSKYNNCTILASQDGPKTLQEIGDLNSLTRMRICQIEKSALKKVRELLFKIM